MSRPACIISCDIIGHARERQSRGHLDELKSLNLTVKRILDDAGDANAAWASRGDGGHIVIYRADWHQTALSAITALHRWSTDNLTPLRIIAHHGPIETFEGADGRPEFAGESINLVGRIGQLASDRQVVVTKAFKEGLDSLGSESPLYPDQFVLDTDDFGPVAIFFLSVGDTSEPFGDRDSSNDHTLLADALKRHASWKVIYHAKRLLELHDGDLDALSALRSLTRRELAFVSRDSGLTEANPIFQSLNKPQTARFIQAAHLVERRAGQILCNFGDTGETMFIILNGAVGVILPGKTLPEFLLRSGEIVGELAFAMHQPRTATLRCLSQTSLLSFDPRSLQARLAHSPGGRSAFTKIREFLKLRVLRYICTNLGFLVGTDGRGPLANVLEPWEELAEYAEIFEKTAGKRIIMGRDEFVREGIYILLAGKIKDLHNGEICKEGGLRVNDKEARLSIIHWNVPGRFVKGEAEYDITNDIVVMYIGVEAFSSFVDREITYDVWERLRKYLVKEFAYDVFLSYTRDDKEKALRWLKRFKNRRWKVFMDEGGGGPDGFREAIVSAIREALFFVPLISGNVVSRDDARNWVRWEIEKRKEMFELNRTNIVPVQLASVDVTGLVDGFKIVEGGGQNEEHALEEVVMTITRAREEGRLPLRAGTGV